MFQCLPYQKVLIIGAGKSGRAAAEFFLKQGVEVTIADKQEPANILPQLQDMAAAGAALVLGGYPEVKAGSFDLVVPSPGVPLSVPPVAAARKVGIPVIGELGLACRLVPGPIVAITGTNGKTTTTALTGEIVRQAGRQVLVAGNIGEPLIGRVDELQPDTVVVLEVSSFQLETADGFRPRVAAILNITPDHLDRHGDMEGYIAAKSLIFRFQQADDWTVLNYDDPLVRSLARVTPARVCFFSRTTRPPLPAVYLEKENGNSEGLIVVEGVKGREVICRREEVRMPGLHNLENALAAAACAYCAGVEPAAICAVLRTFSGVPHRLEPVAEVNGVLYVNDSKGTNPEAAMKALAAYDRPIVLLAGGRNKGSDFTAFARAMKGKVRVLVVLGECRDEIIRAARAAGIEHIIAADSFREAVERAHAAARPGDVVLLSPACASWDMFCNYEERGEMFKQIVRELTAG